MAEGLKLVIGGDVKEAEQALKTFVTGLAKGEDATNKFGTNLTRLEKQVAAFGGGVRRFSTTFTGGFAALPPAIKNTETALSKLPRSSNAAMLSLTNLGRVAQDAPFGFLGIANNLNPLLESFQRLKQESGSTGGALKSLAGSLMGAGGVGLALSVVSSLLIVFGDKLFGTKEASKASEEALKSLTQTLSTVKDGVKALSDELQFANQVGGINVKIRGQGDLQDLTEQSVAQAQQTVNLQGQRDKLKAIGEEITKNTELNKEDRIAAEEKYASELKALDSEIVSSQQAQSLLYRRIAFQRIEDDKEAKLKSIDALKKYIDDAKKLASELEKIGFIQPEFSFFDSQGTTLKKAQKVFRDFASRNLKIDKNFFKIEPTFSEPRPEQVQEALGPIEDGIRSGVISIPPIPVEVNISPEMAANAELLRDPGFIKAFKDIGRALPAIDLEAPPSFNYSVMLDSLRKFFGAAKNTTKEEMEALANEFAKGMESINKAIGSLQIEALAGVGEALGTALAGGDLGSIFSGFVETLASAVQAIGKQFIALGTVAVAAKKSLATLFANPFATIGVGVALVAVGSALKGLMSKGVPAFAAGGLVYGPTLGLVGEGIGTSRSNPEVIAPLDQLKGMLGDLGGGSQHVIVTGRLRGPDMVLQTARTNRSQRRLGR
jgi:hypothetical protein